MSNGLFERNWRGHHPVWIMQLDQRRVCRRQLVFAFSITRIADSGFEIWIEEQRSQYHYIVDEPRKLCKRDLPILRVEHVELKGSRRAITLTSPLEYITASALARNELIGESAEYAVNVLFSTYLADSDSSPGLAYLNKYCPSTCHTYALTKLRSYTDRDASASEIESTALDAIQRATKDQATEVVSLGERICQLALRDAAFRQAVEAVEALNESDDVKNEYTQRLIELHASPLDRAVAAIIAATEEEQSFLGLRACRQAEHDTSFVRAICAQLGKPSSRQNRRVRSLLRASLPKPKEI